MAEHEIEMKMAERKLTHEEEEEEEGDWEDWNAGVLQGGGDSLEEEAEGESLSRCLFCPLQLPSADDAFSHCSSSHNFDFHRIRAQFKLDFYDSIRVINYIRKQVSSSKCIFCMEAFLVQDDLLSHMETVGHNKLPEGKVDPNLKKDTGVSPPWKADEYLTPVLEDDPLLYSFEGDDEVDEDTLTTEMPVVVPESQLADLDPGYQRQLLEDLAESGEGPVDLGVRLGNVTQRESNTANVAFEEEKGQSSSDSTGEGFQADQQLTDEIMALRLENEELKAELEIFRQHTHNPRVSAKIPPTPHPTPAGSPFRHPEKEGALSALGPPHSLKSLQKIGEEAKDINMLAEEDVADGEPMEAEGNNDKPMKGSGSPTLITDDENQAVAGKKKGNWKVSKGKVSFAAVAEKEAQGVDNSYFNSYGQFGIHREMLGDKVRTEAYRAALVENPSLLREAVVMDVGCGTGILSLFAAQGGASTVVAVDASEKIASIASRVAQENGYLAGTTVERSSTGGRPVINVVVGKVEDLKPVDQESEVGKTSQCKSIVPVKEKSVDVLVSEWMGYCLLFESMLSSVLYARDKWLKPGGAVLPDIATMYVAGFGKGGTSFPFWEDVYGFNMSVVGREVVEDAAQVPIVDVLSPKDIITDACLIQSFDIATMEHDDVDFTSFFHLEASPVEDTSTVQETSGGATVTCYGLVVWFDVAFSERFCKDKPVIMSTSPFGTPTHWSQTKLTLKEPIVLSRSRGHQIPKTDPGEIKPFVASSETSIARKKLIGTGTEPAVALNGRISIARSARHRSIDISLEIAAASSDGTVRRWPVHMFDI